MSTSNPCEKSPHVKPSSDPRYQGIIDDKYRVLDFVGGGGTACVYRVRTEFDPHNYALKLLQDKYFRNAFVLEQFRLEGERLLQLQHPNIVRFYEIAIRDTYGYLVMDHIEGYELSDLLKNLRQKEQLFPVNEVMRTLIQASRALDFLHSKDLIHRDIKAANILLEKRTGKLFLVDFGIATEASEAATAFNAGTRAYMPPEQQENIGLVVTKTADVYAFGIMAYEMLAGKRPFAHEKGLKGKEAEQDLIAKHRSAPVPSLEAIRPDLPKGLDAIFKKVLAKSPTTRYQSARDFVMALHQVLLPVLAPELHQVDEVAPLDPYRFLDQATTNRRRSGDVPSTAIPEVTRPLTQTGSSMNELPAKSKVGRLILGLVVMLLLAGGVGLVFLASGDSNDPTPISPTEVVQAETPSETPLTPTEEIVPATEESQNLATEESSPSVSPTHRLVTDATEETTLEATEEIATETAESLPTATLTTTPTKAPTLTETPTFTPTVTVTATLTLTPSQTALPEQPYANLEMLSEGAVLGVEGDLNAALAARFTEAPFIRLNVGEIRGFRAELTLNSAANLTRYGLAYRVQDDQNYLLFTVDPVAKTWRIESIEAGAATELQTGTLITTNPTNLILQGFEDTYRILVGNEVIENLNDQYEAGGLALWLETSNDQSPTLATLAIGVAGLPDVYEILTKTPTPVQFYNPLATLLADLQALKATSPAYLTLSCTDYLPRYNALEAYLDRSPAEREFAQQALDIGALAAALCEANTSATGDFNMAVADFSAWDSGLTALISQMENGQP